MALCLESMAIDQFHCTIIPKIFSWERLRPSQHGKFEIQTKSRRVKICYSESGRNGTKIPVKNLMNLSTSIMKSAKKSCRNLKIATEEKSIIFFFSFSKHKKRKKAKRKKAVFPHFNSVLFFIGMIC